MYPIYWKSWNVIKDDEGNLIMTQETTTFSVEV